MTQCYEYATFAAKARLPIYDYVAMQRGKKLRENLDKFKVTVPGWDDLTDLVGLRTIGHVARQLADRPSGRL